ncbi:MAG: LytTR family DNA-binding domain-containing protein [Oscillospiraceae bacterium]|nr:LytTR family DNA-binding domain-containing protein [Oscillospiraceae bacterium]
MKVAIVDDEKNCRDELSRQLLSFSGVHRCQLVPVPFPSAEAFLEAAERERFDIVFMDIFMEGIDGLDAATRLRELDKRCILIFLTSSADYHPNAFSVHAFEYILKPFTPERVYAVLRDALVVLPSTPRYIEVASERRTVRIPLPNIVSAVTDAHYVNIGLSDGPVVRSRMTILDFLRLVEGELNFITVNKGIVLNADYIARFEDNCCVTENGARFPVRVRDRLKIEQAARDYNFEKIRSRQRHGRGDQT